VCKRYDISPEKLHNDQKFDDDFKITLFFEDFC
jgi:hypothetical protein